MKRLRGMLIFLIGIVGGLAACAQSDEGKIASLQKNFATLQTELQKELAAAIAASGPEGAIEVCSVASPQMERRLSRESGAEIRRVSDRPRNPEHMVDEFERRAMDRWRAEMAQGKKPALYHERSEAGLRVMQPIVIQNNLCLQCHGGPGQISAATAAAIAQRYPQDQAIGYALNDLRGAFSATVAD